MFKQIVPQDLQGNGRSLQYIGSPGECPICHVHIVAQFLTSVICPPVPVADPSPEAVQDAPMQMAYRCTNESCARLFIATYARRMTLQPSPTLPSGEWWELTHVAPTTPIHQDFSSEIQQVSPTFVEIYNQALSAEAMDLTHIAGMGLRKALEFLIKDFTIKQKPNEKDAIEKKLLGSCIKEYVDDPRIKQTAELATWLGNDETHYVRKWADKDISDLKILIRLTVNWIESVELTEQYTAAMAKKPS